MNILDKISKEQNLTRMQIAFKTGITYQTLCHIAWGANQSISEETAVKLSKLAGMTPEEVKSTYSAWRQANIA